MAFTRTNASPPAPARARDSGVRRVAGTIAIAALLWLAALIPYDRLKHAPQEASDLVPLGPSDPPVRTVAELTSAYGISAAAQAHFRVDASGIHHLRKPTPDEEEQK